MRATGAGLHAALVLADGDAGHARTLVSDREDNLSPAFVPHSTKLFFLRSAAFEHYSPLVGSRRHRLEIFSVDSETGQVQQLTHGRFFELGPISVSADGEWLLYSYYDLNGPGFRIAPVAHPDLPKLTLRPVVPNAPDKPPVSGAQWSPDAKSILFEAASKPEGGGNYDYNLYRLTMASGAIETLTHFRGQIDGFSVSRDGSRAVVLQNGNYFIVDLGAHTATKLRITFVD